jgi:hypothetical protein
MPSWWTALVLHPVKALEMSAAVVTGDKAAAVRAAQEIVADEEIAREAEQRGENARAIAEACRRNGWWTPPSHDSGRFGRFGR